MNTMTRRMCLVSVSTLGFLATSLVAQGTSAAEPSGAKPAQKHTHGGTEPSTVYPIPSGVAPGTMPPSLSEPNSNSVIAFEATSVSTGKILDSKPVDLEFHFKNAGTETLEILYIKPACGCTVPEMDKKSYEPGDHGVMKVTFDPSGKSGSISRTITIYTNSISKPVHTVFVQATVNPVIIMQPKVMSFEAAAKGQGATKEFLIYGRFPEFKISRATTQNPETFGIKIIDGGEVTLKGETLWLQKIVVTLKDTAPPKNHRTEVTIRTNDKDKPIFSLPVIGRVIGDLELSPVRMTMGRLIVGDEFEREITLRSKGGESFEIKSVNSSNVALDASYEFEPLDAEKRSEWIVRIKGTVINAAPRFNAQMNIVTDVADESMITVQMYGQLQPKPAATP